jgi:hypothetical protein
MAQVILVDDIESGLRTQKLALAYALLNEGERLAIPLENVLTVLNRSSAPAMLAPAAPLLRTKSS